MKRAALSCLCLVLVGCGAEIVIEQTGDVGPGEGAPPTDPEGKPPSSCIDEVVAEDPSGAISPLLVDGTVYWATRDGSIFRRERGALQNERLVSDLDGGATLAVRGRQLIFAAGGNVARWDQASEQIEVLAAEQSTPFSPMFVGDTLYWLNRGSGILAGDLMRWSPGTGVEVVLESIHVPAALAADDTHVYVLAGMVVREDEAVEGPLIRLAADTGAWDIVAAGIHQPAGMAVTVDSIYFIDQVDQTFSTPGTLTAIDKDTGVTDVVASILGLGVAVVADASDVFFTEFATDASRVRVATGHGGADTVVALPGSTVAEVAVDDEHVIVTSAWSEGAAAPGTPSVRRLCRNEVR